MSATCSNSIQEAMQASAVAAYRPIRKTAYNTVTASTTTAEIIQMNSRLIRPVTWKWEDTERGWKQTRVETSKVTHKVGNQNRNMGNKRFSE